MISSKEAFDKIAPFLQELEGKKLIRRNRTIAAVCTETKELITASQEDRARFAQIPRFDISYVDSLPCRFAAWHYLVTQCENLDSQIERAEKDWENFSPPAKELKRRFLRRRELLAKEERDESCIAELKQISGGKGRARLVRDFAAIRLMIERDQKKLLSIGLDGLFCKMVLSTEKTLNRLQQEYDKPFREREVLLEQIHKSYTYLAEAVNAISRYGRMIFAGTTRERLYISESLYENTVRRSEKRRQTSYESPLN